MRPLPNGALKLNLLLACGTNVPFIATHEAAIELCAELLVHLGGHLPELKERFAALKKIDEADVAHGHPGEPSNPNPSPDAPKQ